MDFFTWHDDLIIGVENIDNQHKKYFEILKDLHEAVSLGKGADVQEALFQELAEYISTHFSDEEALMQELGFPFYNIQLKEHQGFTAKVNALRKKELRNETNVSAEALAFMRDWFVHHIMQHDKQIGKFIQKKKG